MEPERSSSDAPSCAYLAFPKGTFNLYSRDADLSRRETFGSLSDFSSW